jgi:hypothetical protein
MKRILQDRQVPLKTIVPGCPPLLSDLVDRALEKDPEKRFQTCLQFGEALKRCRALLGASEEPNSGKMWIWVLTAASVAVLAFAVFIFLHQQVGPGKEANEQVKKTPPPQELPIKIQTSTGPMVLVSKGTFLEGPNKTAEELPAFYIDRTEVTNEAYKAFAVAMQYPLPPGFTAAKPEFPVVNVTIQDAKAFALWAGKRLPTRREWEKAARGRDGRLFPWGDDPDPGKANVLRKGRTPTLSSADSFSEGASYWGALQMVGNVWELIDEARPPSDEAVSIFRKLLVPPPTKGDPWYIMMGGALNLDLEKIPIWDTASVPGSFKGADIGFRCVKDVTPRPNIGGGP